MVLSVTFLLLLQTVESSLRTSSWSSDSGTLRHSDASVTAPLLWRHSLLCTRFWRVLWHWMTARHTCGAHFDGLVGLLWRHSELTRLLEQLALRFLNWHGWHSLECKVLALLEVGVVGIIAFE